MGLLALLGPCAQMLVVALIGYVDQPFVKPALVCATLVTAYQQDGLPLGVKGIVKEHAPSHVWIMHLKTYGVKTMIEYIDEAHLLPL